MKVYLAGHMHSDWRNQVIDACAEGVEFLIPLPTPDRAENGAGDPSLYMVRDLALLRQADLVFALLDDIARGIGVAAEIGYAYGRGVPIIVVNLAPQVHSFQFLEGLATRTYSTLAEGINALRFATQSPRRYQ
ncbi:MAG: nucleoside 2-deoxyribosyltransferase [Chloroflexota bacterium]|nr:nucleoside 2-deoxyribosyltransferase [Chloroflexota bacterium]